MRFREFILQEDFGLGDLGLRIDKTFQNNHFNQQSGAYLSTDFSGTEQNSTLGSAGKSLHLPSTDLSIPQIERTSRIKILERSRNPIYMELSDGTKAHFTYDEFRRIKGNPEIGKVITIIFQRHPGDRTNNHSKIDQAIVRDG